MMRSFVAGAVVLAIAMGVGRFVYTPLLVDMHREGSLSLGFAGVLASANLAGYLLGAMLAMLPAAHHRRTLLVRAGSIVVVATTALMALPQPVWLPARFVTGVASGIVFVLTVSLMLDVAAHARARFGMAVVFAGVGAGIAAAGALVIPLDVLAGARGAWLGLTGLSALALALVWPAVPHPHVEASSANAPAPAPRDGGSFFGWLALLYGVEGAAYIIPATFLVAIVAEAPSIARYGALTWILVGLVAAPSALWWNAAARRWSRPRALAVACAAQAVSMIAPFVLPAAASACVLAVGLGGTFIGIAALSTALARHLRPARVSAAIGLLTALYGVGQVIGPLAATRIMLDTGSYRVALLLAAVLLGLATSAFWLQARSRARMA
jgi:predicted MFS family arabinose efflux permease